MTEPYRPAAIAVPREALQGAVPDLLALIYAELAGERPRCACRPIHAWPMGGPVIGYSDVCDDHRIPMTAVLNPHDAAAPEDAVGPLPDGAVTVSHPIPRKANR